MTPDLLTNISSELKTQLEGSIISSVKQSDEKTLTFKIFTGRAQIELFISCHPKFSRLHLNTIKRVYPPRPLRFCAFLRSRIEGAKIERFTQLSGERIIEIFLIKKLDNYRLKFKLIIELTGKSSNIILLDEQNIVLDALKLFKKDSSPRPVEPGLPLSSLPTTEISHEAIEFALPKGASWNKAAEEHFAALENTEVFTLLKQSLISLLTTHIKKCRHLKENLLNDKKDAEDSVDASRFGDLIMSNFNNVKKGLGSVTVKNIFSATQEDIVIKLDPLLNAQENAARYYKKAKKASTTLALLKTRMPELQHKITKLEGLLEEARSASQPQLLSKLEETLIKEGITKQLKSNSTNLKSDPKSTVIKKFRSSDGFDILLGRSAKANDILIKEYARDEDLWFHAKGYAGAHVLLKFKSKTKPFTEKSIYEAASIAAENSKVSASSKAEVICAQAKNVKKPKGAKAGAVTVDEYKTILVKIRGNNGQLKK